VDIGTLPGFCDHFNFLEASAAEEDAFLSTIRRSGLQVHTFTTNIGEFNEPGAPIERYLAAGRRNIRVAAAVGAYAINLNCGTWFDRSRQPFAEGIVPVAAGIRALAPEAAASGVRLTIEAPHKGKLCRDADEALALLQMIGHSNVTPMLDTNHHAAAGWGMARAVEAFGARNICLVHLRDAVHCENRYPLGAGEVNFRELFTALRAGGYAGRYSFEFTDAAPTVDGNAAVIRASREYLVNLNN